MLEIHRDFRSLFLKNAIVSLMCTRKIRKKMEMIQILKSHMCVGVLCNI